MLSSEYNAYNSFGFFKPVWDFLQDQNGTELNMRTFKFVFPDEQNFHKDRCGNNVNSVRFLNFNNGIIVRNKTEGLLQNAFSPENMFWNEENGGINPIDPERFLNIYIGKLFDYKPGIQPIIDFNYSNRSELKGFFFGKFDSNNIYNLPNDCDGDKNHELVFVQDLFV